MDEKKPSSPLEDFEARLRHARQEANPETDESVQSQPRSMSGLGIAMRIGVELVVAVAIGVAIGLGLDHWLGTAPFLMILFLFLGAAAGVMNVYRLMQGLDQTVGLEQARKRKAERTKDLKK